LRLAVGSSQNVGRLILFRHKRFDHESHTRRPWSASKRMAGGNKSLLEKR
jgi:hypothetical protein